VAQTEIILQNEKRQLEGQNEDRFVIVQDKDKLYVIDRLNFLR